ncbi:uncharacterized protein V1516DRAFT_710316 [Lipomyces oligophaga]|uniref:uncharacterized protein n=1 Tax=Lipomyces oligophaga TaxID=45792 RepID=UPI0034D01F2C
MVLPSTSSSTSSSSSTSPTRSPTERFSSTSSSVRRSHNSNNPFSSPTASLPPARVSIDYPPSLDRVSAVSGHRPPLADHPPQRSLSLADLADLDPLRVSSAVQTPSDNQVQSTISPPQPFASARSNFSAHSLSSLHSNSPSPSPSPSPSSPSYVSSIALSSPTINNSSPSHSATGSPSLSSPPAWHLPLPPASFPRIPEMPSDPFTTSPSAVSITAPAEPLPSALDPSSSPNSQPVRRRNRGLSLRTQLFNRTIVGTHGDSPIELTDNLPYGATGPHSPVDQVDLATPESFPDDTTYVSNLSIDPSFHAPPYEDSGETITRKHTVDDLDDPRKSFYLDSLDNQISIGQRQLEHYSAWNSAKRRLQSPRISSFYRRLSDWVFNRNQIPPSIAGRQVPYDLRAPKALFVDERTLRPYVSNIIVSSVYNRYNALPLLLIAQFLRLANVYFLIVSILQMIPNFSTTGTYNSFATFMVFTFIAMAREGFDDWQRHRQDKSENLKEAFVGHLGYKEDGQPTIDWRSTRWQDIRVGDIVRLERNDWVPCDLIVLHGNGMGDQAYVETAALDGETNLKSKVALPALAEIACTDEALAAVDPPVEFVVEDPNTDLYNFEGNVTVDGEKLSLSNDNIIYRGCIIRNTPRVIGFAVFTGQETKIRMNATQAPRVKTPRLQGRINKIIVFMVLFVCFISAFCTLMERFWVNNGYAQEPWYLPSDDIPLSNLIIGFIIMFNTLIPLSLYVSMEIVKIGQRIMIGWDIDMYYEPTETRCEPHTSSINEELGQISYIFSDKTGTLTDNVMVFRKISVAGHSWLHDLDVQQEFFQEEMRRLKESGVVKKSSTLNSHKRTPTTVSFAPSETSQIRPLGRKSTNLPNAFRRTETIRESFSSLSVAPSRMSRPHWRSSVYGRPSRISTGLTRASTTRTSGHPVPSNSIQHVTRSTKELLEYLQLKPNTPFSRSAIFFLLAIALCHGCQPDLSEDIDRENGEAEEDNAVESRDGGDSEINYQSSSPDELALVRAARDLGFVVIDRQFSSITVRTYPRGYDAEPLVQSYEILNTIEFSSNRKRMSIILKLPDGRICLLCKGADTIVFDRLASAKLAESTKVEVQRKVTIRRNMEASRAMAIRVSTEHNSPLVRESTSSAFAGPSSSGPGFSAPRMSRDNGLNSLDGFLASRDPDAEIVRAPRISVEVPVSSSTMSHSSPFVEPDMAILETMVDENVVHDTAEVFKRTLNHIDEFATEGLRTLVYAHRFLSEDEYKQWAKIYSDATTSIDDRTAKIEAAGELIESNLELTGATAIEDKLQNGVPEAIEKLRRAGIKLWMLTGDKRETAISIGHSCRLIHDYSTVLILRSDDADMVSKMAAMMLELVGNNIAHCVIVIDGATLAQIERDVTLMSMFIDLGVKANSVICCRASPSQKALLVTSVRSKVKGSVTLAIGDGANDIAMIQAADVGIGIAGREGLQAARSSDFSVGQFRFLLKLLLVHGRWNYVRLSKYVLATFYKEFFFYLTQAMFQRYTMYSGTSLYESISLTMYNTLFTSLPVICIGIFMQDLSPETLVAVPELYSTSRLNKHFSLRIFIGWMCVASSQAVLVTFTMLYVYGLMYPRDNGLYPPGTLNFAAIIAAIAIKLCFTEMHNRTVLSLGAILISTLGWFFWTLCLTQIYGEKITLYVVKDTLIETFGKDLTWWSTFLICCGVAVVFDIVLVVFRAAFFPSDTDTFQQIEQDDVLRARLEQEAEMELQQSWAGSKVHQKRQQKLAMIEAKLQEGREAEEQEIRELLRNRDGLSASNNNDNNEAVDNPTVGNTGGEVDEGNDWRYEHIRFDGAVV